MDAAMQCGHTGARFGVQPFIAAASFAGARAGYAFKLGAQGAGYYEDRVIAWPLLFLPLPHSGWGLRVPAVSTQSTS